MRDNGRRGREEEKVNFGEGQEGGRERESEGGRDGETICKSERVESVGDGE